MLLHKNKTLENLKNVITKQIEKNIENQLRSMKSSDLENPEEVLRRWKNLKDSTKTTLDRLKNMNVKDKQIDLFIGKIKTDLEMKEHHLKKSFLHSKTDL